MRHIFLTARTEGISRWTQAFPDAEVMAIATLRNVLPCASDETLIWLHLGPESRDLAARIAQVMQIARQCPIVVLADVPVEEEGLQALKAGAGGYTSSLTAPDLLRRIATVIEHGGVWVGRDLKRRLLDSVRPAIATSGRLAALAGLSPRQRDAAYAVAAGASNKEVARMLGITERTVKAHLSAIFEQLGIRDRVQLTLLVNSAGRPQG